MQLSDQEILRYNRQISLKSVDFEGQEQLKASRVLIVGLGGLGCAASQYLASAGVGHLTLVDFDEVSLSNLQRQVLYSEADLGLSKVQQAKIRLTQLNPYIEIKAIHQKLTFFEWHHLIPQFQVIVDCTDNVTIRQQLNQICFEHKIPLVSGAAIRFEGQVSVFTYTENEPCYHCFSQLFGENVLSCVEAGIISAMVGIIGSIQALETIKLLLAIGQTLTGKLLMIDGLNFAIRELKLPKQSVCSVCSKEYNQK